MQRLLIIGCGDVALRAVPRLRARYRIYALTHSRERMPMLRSHGVIPIAGDLDDAASLHGLAGIAHEVLHCAPPPNRGTRDTRTAHLIAALAKGKSLPQQLAYISTSGVYGDCGGEIVDETRQVRPRTDRARRRVDAELQLRGWGKRSHVCVSILRAPGIYSGERLPLERLRADIPALHAADDAYTNHVHADDLARMAVAALRFGHPGRMYNASDDSRIKMGDYFDLVADRFGLPHPRRVSRFEANQRIPANLLSFMSESRQLSNRRIKQELRIKLRYPTVREGIAAAVLRHRG
ncbi:MAG TPA: NAD-dependent epimerase/dehydratase family protein [Burkholderiales bacterium]|nr:NAD-dependent epimerase/dehydratase family protein [Burkholderiales bacterium]